MKLINPFKKSQTNYDVASDPRAWDRGLTDIGDLRYLLDYYNNLMKGGGGTSIYSTPQAQIAQIKSWVYTVINTISWEIADNEWYITKKMGDTWERVEGDRRVDDFLKILDEPWPYADETSLKYKIIQHLDSCGKCNLDIVTNGPEGKVLLGLAPYDPTKMSFHLDGRGLIDGWKYGGSFIPKDRVIYIWYPQVNSLYDPMSPIEAMSGGVDLNSSMLDFVSKTVKNGGRRTGYVTPDESVNMGVEKLSKLFEWAQKETTANGGIGIIPAKVKLLSQSHSPRDMDYIEGRDRMIEEICAGYGYPAALLHGKELNRAVMEVLTLLKDKRCINPRLTLIETALSKQLVHRFLGPDYWLTFKRKPFQFSDDVYKMLDLDMKYGIRTANEVRGDRGLEPATWEGADEPFKQSAPAQPFQQPQAGTEEPPKSLPVLTIKENKTVDRVALWKSFDNLARANERPMKTAVKRYFSKQRENVKAKAKALNDAGKLITIDGIFDHSGAMESMKSILLSHINNAAESGYERGCLQCEAEHTGKSDAKIRNHAKTKATNSAKLITDTTRQRIADVLAANKPAKAEGVMITFEDFIKELDGLFDTFEDSRTNTITETEVISALNWGSQAGYQDSGADGKEWLSQQDGRVRGPNSIPPSEYNHGLDGVVVPLNGKFNTGPEMLEYPGDPSGDPGNICNCRCTVLPAFNN